MQLNKSVQAEETEEEGIKQQQSMKLHGRYDEECKRPKAELVDKAVGGSVNC